MPKARSATAEGLESHYKVRVVLPGAILHLASRTEPVIETDGLFAYNIEKVTADWINDPNYGDTIGVIDWTEVTAITWRYSA